MRGRDFLATVAAAGVAAVPKAQAPPAAAHTGRVKQALMRVKFGRATTRSFDEKCREAARLGAHGFDLIAAPDWPTLKKHGLVCTMAPAMGVTIRDGLIRPELHGAIAKAFHEAIGLCAAHG